MKNLLHKDTDLLLSTYDRLPLIIKNAEGHYIYDQSNKKYLDLFSGVAVNNIGHRHPKIMETLMEQASCFLHISNHFINPPAIEFAENLIKHTFDGKIFFTNSGTEATETAIKLIHKHVKNLNEQHRGIVVLKNSYHGRTTGSMLFTRQEQVHQDFPCPNIPFYEVNPNDTEQLKKVFQQYKPHAILFECVLGAGGVLPLTTEYISEISSLSKKYHSLVCIDEIQTGFGRTGSLFCYQKYDIQPDILLFAKASGGGIPLGGALIRNNLTDLFKKGDHGSTFAPNPLGAALGNTLLNVLLEEKIIETAISTSDYFVEKLYSIKEEFGFVKEIRHNGMMFGIELNLTDEFVKQIQLLCLERGFLVDVTQKHTIRLLPPLTLQKVEIDKFIDSFREVLLTLFTF